MGTVYFLAEKLSKDGWSPEELPRIPQALTRTLGVGPGHFSAPDPWVGILLVLPNRFLLVCPPG